LKKNLDFELNEDFEKIKAGKIKWNFTKFLISRDGEVKYRFNPKVTPNRLTNYIEELLNT